MDDLEVLGEAPASGEGEEQLTRAERRDQQVLHHREVARGVDLAAFDSAAQHGLQPRHQLIEQVVRKARCELPARVVGHRVRTRAGRFEHLGHPEQDAGIAGGRHDRACSILRDGEYLGHAFLAEVGVVGLALMFGLPRLQLPLLKRLPAPLAVVLVGIVLGRVLGLSGPDLIHVPDKVLAHGLVMPDFKGLLADPSITRVIKSPEARASK